MCLCVEIKQPETDRKRYFSPIVGLTRSSSWRTNVKRYSNSGEEWSNGE